jgi:L-threonylcarbamoyladenylate synthase
MPTISIPEAAELLRRGRLVAFPTETVYGLGANALDLEAVARIFAAKGRPRTNPLIVHVASVDAARELVTAWPPAAQALAEKFWPGPLTIVLPKRPVVPDLVTAGLATVGIRIPSHPIALELLRAAAIPVAAPSANLFTQLSPVRAGHVQAAFSDEVPVVEGGISTIGIESTVLSLAGQPTLLRPGSIARSQLEAVIGPVAVLAGPSVSDAPNPTAHTSPGQHAQHYQPRTRLILGSPPSEGRGVYLHRTHPAPNSDNIAMPQEALAYAARLYDTLHSVDTQGYAWIAVEPVPDTVDWDGVRDRLKRAVKALKP